MFRKFFMLLLSLSTLSCNKNKEIELGAKARINLMSQLNLDALAKLYADSARIE